MIHFKNNFNKLLLHFHAHQWTIKKLLPICHYFVKNISLRMWRFAFWIYFGFCLVNYVSQNNVLEKYVCTFFHHSPNYSRVLEICMHYCMTRCTRKTKGTEQVWKWLETIKEHKHYTSKNARNTCSTPPTLRSIIVFP